MSSKPTGDVTSALEAIRAGDDGARDRLVGLIYDELRASARRLMRGERAGHTLQPTALVHESILRVVDTATLQSIENRRQLFAAAVLAMKRILIDHARARAAQKRGGGRRRVPLEGAAEQAVDDAEVATPAEPIAAPGDFLDRLVQWYEEQGLDIVALDDAIDEVRELEPRWGEVILLRFFGGYTIEQTANMLDVSPRTVADDWNKARAWLRVRLEERDDRADGSAAPDDGPVRGGEPA
jgi:RNA polymerase sigma factor (sigma-70 family)